MPKRIVPLSDAQIKKTKPGEKDYKLSDGGGMFLLVTTTGGKLWRMNYRFDGKQKTLALGAYPDVSLALARDRRDAARSELARGIDPGLAKKSQRQARGTGNTFEAVAREWHARMLSTWVERHAENKLSRLQRDVFPWIGAIPVAEVTAADVLGMLRKIEERGLIDTAHRARVECGQVMRYAVATGRAERDVTADLRGALPPNRHTHRAAPTDPEEIAPLLRAIQGFKGSPVVRAALVLGPLTFVRPGELRAAEWEEIDFKRSEWNIPAGKMKMKIAHLVPLSRQALDILQELKPLTGHSRYVFPCQRSPLRCMSDNAVNAALRRMGFEKTEIVGHGFRAMARTVLDEVLGVRPDFIEHQLAHVVRDPNGRAYNRTAHLEARREMMQLWADYLDGLKVSDNQTIINEQ